jgi:hypothetical protein
MVLACDVRPGRNISLQYRQNEAHNSFGAFGAQSLVESELTHSILSEESKLNPSRIDPATSQSPYVVRTKNKESHHFVQCLANAMASVRPTP